MTQESNTSGKKKIVVAGLVIVLLGSGIGGVLYLSEAQHMFSHPTKEKNQQSLLQRRVADTVPKKKTKDSRSNGLERIVTEDSLVSSEERPREEVDTETHTGRTKAKQVALEAIANLPDELGEAKAKEDIRKVAPPTPILINQDKTAEASAPDQPSYAYPYLEGWNVELHVGSPFQPLDYVKATDELDGDLTDEVEVIQNHVNLKQEGTYTVRYRVTNRHGLSNELDIQVHVLNDAPVILADNHRISLQQPYDPLVGITATDTEDGDVTKAIRVVENHVQTNQEGLYSVTYAVMDRNGKETEKTIQVEVKNDAPIIQAENQVLLVDATYDPLEGVTATDVQDGDITQQIEVIQNEVNTHQAGLYHVTYRVVDAQGQETTKTIEITVQAPPTPPVLEVPVEFNTTIGVTPDWLQDVHATDQEDGDLTSQVTVDDSQVDILLPGNYLVYFSVTDSSGEKCETSAIVHVQAIEES
ncbi:MULTISPECIES: immunoglobulin-like domain-containing protein [Listeria]|uniref:immunoglobulin-like domain-containing protein n=1 Tax=Listeria TaxID=1637 RepID=UPI000B58A556|nr:MULTISPECIES: immunoglobulin-like domain-containing protein [Listeria]